jgi:prepilin-type N-terminal cleavage/methylation domain-containing protein
MIVGRPVSPYKWATAVTLVEVMIAMAVLSIAATGALSYQWHAVRQARIAHAQITATRIGRLLLEDWKSTGGSTEYSPGSLGLGFSDPLKVPAHWSQGEGQGLGTPLHDGVFGITVDDVAMQVMLTWADVETDTTAQMTLRQLNVSIKFVEGLEATQDMTPAEYKAQASNPLPSGSLAAYNPATILTTYARLDASGG